jgi:hypothetical protein
VLLLLISVAAARYSLEQPAVEAVSGIAGGSVQRTGQMAATGALHVGWITGGGAAAGPAGAAVVAVTRVGGRGGPGPTGSGPASGGAPPGAGPAASPPARGGWEFLEPARRPGASPADADADSAALVSTSAAAEPRTYGN